jgi:hypothetical protein
MQYGIDIERLSHNGAIPGLCPSVSHATMSDELRRIGQTMFTQCLRKVRQNDQFMNLVCNAETVIHFKIVHAALSHPSRFSKVIPLEPYKNLDWNADRNESSFRKTVTALLSNDDNRPLEVCGTIFDKFPARVSSLLHFINGKEGQGRELFMCVVSVT